MATSLNYDYHVVVVVVDFLADASNIKLKPVLHIDKMNGLNIRHVVDVDIVRTVNVCCIQVSPGVSAGDSQLATSQTVLQLKQKIDQLSQQLAVERTQKAQLVSPVIEIPSLFCLM